MGRPTKLTPEVQGRIVAAILDGNYLEIAAAAGGVSYDAFNEWMAKGEAGVAPYRQFRQSVLEAEARAERDILAAWKRAIPDNWQAARDLLTRRHPQRWAPKEKSEVTVRGDADAPIAFISLIQPPRMIREGSDDDA